MNVLNLRNRWRSRRNRFEMQEQTEREELIRELEQAKADWNNARNKLDHVVDKDQIDYVIYLLEAAEKRYNMLLKKAKQKNILISMDEWKANGIVMNFGSEEEKA